MFDIFFNPKLIILIILIITVLICLGIFKIREKNAQKIIAIGTLLMGIPAIGALCVLTYQTSQLKSSIDLQTRSIEIQTERFNLEKRPYLWVELKKRHIATGAVEKRSIFGGGNLHYYNKGEVPAGDIKLEFIVESDIIRTNELDKWFKEARGGFPQIKTVFPNQSDLYVGLHPFIGNMGNLPKLIFIGALITYTGMDKNKKYWYKAEWLYEIIYKIKIEKLEGKVKEQQEIQEVAFSPLKIYTDWDRNTNFEVPELKEPDWDYYLSIIGK
ncbi:MAG: hypothetical protein JRJ38_16595 [Deltaproteobacteria bacterium]|nr:hypothetical protein [Deltaproteobacteria bacterium]